MCFELLTYTMCKDQYLSFLVCILVRLIVYRHKTTHFNFSYKNRMSFEEKKIGEAKGIVAVCIQRVDRP